MTQDQLAVFVIFGPFFALALVCIVCLEIQRIKGR
jgi:hypothetical protein